MYTQCADCLTIYKIGAELLATGHGQFRCGHCGSVFNALPSLTEKLPEGVIEELPRADAVELPPVLSVPAMRPVKHTALSGLVAREEEQHPNEARREPTLPAEWIVFQPAQPQRPDAHAPPSTLAVDPTKRERYSAQGRAQFDLSKPSGTPPVPKPGMRNTATLSPRAEAGFNAPMRRVTPMTPEPPRYARWPWITLSLLLSMSLLGQLAWYQRQVLLTDPDLRPWLDRACATLRCVLPLRTDPEELSLLDRDVKPHPRSKGALMISASLRNDAGFTQAFPIVEVKLTDLSRRPVALRRFYPMDYLSDASAGATGLAPQATLPLVFEVVDPGRQAVNFEFAFLSP